MAGQPQAVGQTLPGQISNRRICPVHDCSNHVKTNIRGKNKVAFVSVGRYFILVY
jgi:hypothetical protein